MNQLPTLTKEQQIQLSRKDIAKLIKEHLKQEYPNCVFSVGCQSYSGGGSITVCLMKSDRKIIRKYEDISEIAIARQKSFGYTEEQIKERQSEKYHQLGTLRHEYDETMWCNGVFLTEEGHKIIQRVVQISDVYNWDNSDPQSDYFDVHFYLNVNIGKWDTPFIENEQSSHETTKGQNPSVSCEGSKLDM
jgi:hypothetical protein